MPATLLNGPDAPAQPAAPAAAPGAPAAECGPSPPGRGDSPGGDDVLYEDQDDAQALIEPTISPVATRLTLPKTPAAEKAAALRLPPGAGVLDSSAAEGPPSPPDTPAVTQEGRVLRRPRAEGLSIGPFPPPRPQEPELPTPWKSGPKLLVKEPEAPKPALAGVFDHGSRQHRSSSMGADALKRLSKAFPNLSVPGHLIPNLPQRSFFSSGPPASSSPRLPKSPRAGSPKPAARAASPKAPEEASAGAGRAHIPSPLSSQPSLAEPVPIRPARPLPGSGSSLGLRRTTSDESVLYTSLSRVSSFGDDDRFTDIKEQVNSRLKAIMDSFEPPFKLPQMPNIIPSPVKKQFSFNEGTVEPAKAASTQKSPRTPRDGMSALDDVLETLTGDIVILGGYRGSILRSAEPPHRQLWVPVKVGLNIRKVNMEVGLDPEDEENMEKTIFPSGMLQNIGPVDISRRLFKKLRDSDNARAGKLRVHDYGYDWRLSPHLLSRKLVEFLERLPSNRGPRKEGALVIAHSLGGLITRHAVNQRPELFSGVIYAGSPQRCINILGPVRNGDAVLLNEKVLTAQVNFSLRTTFVFLPEDGFCFVDKNNPDREYRVDYFNVDDWIKYRLSPCVSDGALPPFGPSQRTGPFGTRSLLNLSDNLPFRGRSASEARKGAGEQQQQAPDHARHEAARDRTLAPQMGASSGDAATQQQQQQAANRTPGARARSLEYLRRTLAEVKRFRAELAHDPAHTAANAYPPCAVIYGKDVPTVYAARVACREAIACADAFDDLVFRSGDGVVLAREAMLPEGYEVVRDGRVCSDKGHITLLADLPAVGKALHAVVRGRRKGIGLGPAGEGE